LIRCGPRKHPKWLSSGSARTISSIVGALRVKALCQPAEIDLLYACVIVRLGRRDLVWINVTANPTAEWVVRQITEAFSWDKAPHYLIRDRDPIYGSVVTRRLRAMGIRDKPIAPASPWQNGFVERLIGSIRRECVDHIIVLVRQDAVASVLKSYAEMDSSISRGQARLTRCLPKECGLRRFWLMLVF
jgi:hypothetical protein